MNATPMDSATIVSAPKISGWPRNRWMGLIALVFAMHVALIFAFAARKPIVPCAIKNVPRLQLADEKNELLGLTDPTLFALPRPEIFSPGDALKLAGVQAPPRWLPLPDQVLDATFSAALKPEPIRLFSFDFKPPPKFAAPVLPLPLQLPKNSTWKLAGDLAEKKLLSPLEFPVLPDNDVLQPTILQMLVDPDGNVVSAVLLQTSGLDSADTRALEISRSAHFDPANTPAFGLLIVHWKTVPLPATNLPAISP